MDCGAGLRVGANVLRARGERRHVMGAPLVRVTWRAAPRHGSSPRTRERYACEPHAHRRRAGIGARKSVARAADCPSCHVADRRRLLMPRALEVSRTRAYRVHQFTSFTNHDIRLAALVTGERSQACLSVCRSVYSEYVPVAEISVSARIAQAVIIYSLSLTLTLSVTNAVSSILNIALRSFPRGPCRCFPSNSVARC
jgi:hypothetical protein